MSRRRKGKPTWQNLWHKRPEDVSDEAFDRWCDLQNKISDGMQRSMDNPKKRISTYDLELEYMRKNGIEIKKRTD